MKSWIKLGTIQEFQSWTTFHTDKKRKKKAKYMNAARNRDSSYTVCALLLFRLHASESDRIVYCNNIVLFFYI